MDLALFREVNEEIRRIGDGFGADEPLELVCECVHADCLARLTVSRQADEAVAFRPASWSGSSI